MTTLSGKPSMPTARSAQVHGPVQPLDEPRKELITWIGLGVGGLIVGCFVFLALCVEIGPVGA